MTDKRDVDGVEAAAAEEPKPGVVAENRDVDGVEAAAAQEPKPGVVADKRAVDEVGEAPAEEPKPDAVVTESTDAPEVTEGKGAASVGVVGRVVRWCARSWVPLAAATFLVAALGLAAGLYWYQYRVDQQTNDAAAHAAITAASDGTVALLSYSPDSLDRDFSAAKTHLTGDFLSYYTHFTQQIVEPTAKQKGVKTSAAVVQSALSDMHPDRAVVLLFLNQSTTSTERPDPTLTASSVLVTLTKVNGSWLISKFDPV